MRVVFLLLACALLPPGPRAAPSIDPLMESQVDLANGCRFRSPGSAQSQGRIVLQMNGEKAALHISGRPVTLHVEEEQCTDCWYPGKSGVKVFRLTGGEVRATVIKPVFCSRDAEVCSGMHQGKARLVVTTAKGRRTASVWNDDCDY
jgi:hypothetical protein